MALGAGAWVCERRRNGRAAEAAARARATQRERARGLEARGELGCGAAAQRRGGEAGWAGPSGRKGKGGPFRVLNFKQFPNEFEFEFEVNSKGSKAQNDINTSLKTKQLKDTLKGFEIF